MLKYLDSYVTLAEVPDELSLCINIIDCPIHCKGCSEPWMWDTYKGEYPNNQVPKILDEGELEMLINKNEGITCVCFMGGDKSPEDINKLAEFIHDKYQYKINAGWYSGKASLPKCIDYSSFRYVKLGPYYKDKGGLDNPNTNQKLYQYDKYYSGYTIGKGWRDITYKFRK